MTLQQIFWVIALVLFIFAALALGVVTHPIEWGLAALTAGFIVGPIVIIPTKTTTV